ncbi:MAG: hypothetical protein R3314_11405 [Longimicrobiales bacterium]|nr:hypothetical protein [Longimicrobiales bacterium]
MRLTPFTGVLALTVLAAPLAGQVAPIPDAELAAIRAATEKYMDIDRAIADGYVLPMKMCISAPDEGLPAQLGGMGLHYVRPDLLGITGEEPRVAGDGTHTDFLTPAVLIYQPMPDGSQKLVAIENLVWAGAWHAAGNDGPPDFHGFQYYYMHDNPETEIDEAHGFEPHYELHFWLYEDNPAGMFAPFNPRVSCDGYDVASTG